MIKQTLVALSLSLAALTSTDVLAQKRGNDFPRASPNASVTQTVGITDITVSYGRPYVKGRTVFGDLEKFGKVWRVGANEATTITFANDVKVLGHDVKAGTYALEAIPSEKEWTVIINGKPDQWGAFTYDSTKDVLRETVHPLNVPHTEMLTFEFSDVTPTSTTLSFTWGTTRVPIHIDVNTETYVRLNVARATTNSTDGKEYLAFARWAYSANFMTSDAVEWSKKAVAANENYNSLAIAARLHARAGRYKEAVQFAERAMKADQSKKSEPPVWEALDDALPIWKSKL